MQILLPILNFICLFASILYIVRYARAKLPWFLGLLATAVLSTFAPKIMEFIGGAALTVYFLAGAGFVILLLSLVAVTLSRPSVVKEENVVEQDEEGRLSSHTQIRYLYGSVRSEADATDERRESETAILLTETVAREAKIVKESSKAKRKRVLSERRRQKLDEKAERKREAERSVALEEKRNLSTWAGDFRSAAASHWQNGEDTEDLQPEATKEAYEGPSASKTAYVEPYETAIEIHAESYVYEDPEVDRIELGAPQGIEMQVKKPSKPEVMQTKAGKPLEEVRPDDEMLMDLGFTLMGERKWSDAADVFLSFRESTRVSWLRKQADVERLNALIHAKRTADAVDLVFSILGQGYDLSEQERIQIENVLRGLQGEW